MIKNLALGGGSNRMLLILALLLGLLAAVLVGVYLSGLNEDDGGTGTGNPAGATLPVVVAAVDIPAQTLVTDQMVVVKNVPVDVAVLGALADPAIVVGRTASVNIFSGEQIIPTKVTDATTAQGIYGPTVPLSLVVPQGKRAITVLIGQIASAGGMVRPGDRVDLLQSNVQQSTDENAAGGIATSCYVLQDVQVLTIGTNIAPANAETDASVLAGTLADGAARFMIVAVSPLEAATLASAQGKPGDGSVETPLWAVLRPYGDHAPATEVTTCGQAPA